MGGARACIGKPIIQCNYISNRCSPQYIPTQNQLTDSLSSPTTTQSPSTPTMVHTTGNVKSTNYAMEESSADSKSLNEKATTTSAVPVGNTLITTTDQSISTQGTTEQMTPRLGNVTAKRTALSDGSSSTEEKLTSGEADPATTTSQMIPTNASAITLDIISGPPDLAVSTSAVTELKSVTGSKVSGPVDDKGQSERSTTFSGGLNKIERKSTSNADNVGSTTHTITSSDPATTNNIMGTDHSARASYGTMTPTPADDPTISPSKRMPVSASSGKFPTEVSQTPEAAGVYTKSTRGSASPSGEAHGSGSPGPGPRVPTVPALQINGTHSGLLKNRSEKGRCKMKMIQVCENQPSQTPTPTKKNFSANAEKEMQSLRSPPIICETMDFSWKDWTKADCQTSHIAIGLIASLIVMTIFALIALSDIFNVCGN